MSGTRTLNRAATARELDRICASVTARAAAKRPAPVRRQEPEREPAPRPWDDGLTPERRDEIRAAIARHLNAKGRCIDLLARRHEMRPAHHAVSFDDVSSAFAGVNYALAEAQVTAGELWSRANAAIRAEWCEFRTARGLPTDYPTRPMVEEVFR